MKFLSRFPRLGRCSIRLQTRPTAFFWPHLELLEERTLLNASPTSAVLQADYGQLPLAFTVNEGQASPQINYVAQANGYGVALSAQQTQISLGNGNNSTFLDVQLVGGNESAQATGQKELITKTNYLEGNDPSQWLTNLANYGQVEYQNVYRGVDAVYSGNQGQLETTFLVHPGANANAIQMKFQGAESLSLDAQGNLVIHTAGGDMTDLAPVLYQQIDGTRQAVSGHYVLEGNNTVGFQVGSYDPSQTLVFDPTLSYSTYLSGYGWEVAVDSSGNTYVTGANGGGLGTIGGYLAKLDTTGTALDWLTYFGKVSTIVSSFAVDASGNVYDYGRHQ